MSDKIFKSNEARQRMESWYGRFLKQVEGDTQPRDVTTSYGTSHVLMVGDPSYPPLVCLHAMMTSSANLASELSVLLDRYYLILPDLPGYSVRGLPMHLSYSDDSHAQWLLEIFDQLNLKESPLLGVSLGGFVARKFASKNPGRVNSLILIVPAGIVRGSMVKGILKIVLPLMMYKLKPTKKRRRKFVSQLLTTWDDEWARYLCDAFDDFKMNLEIPPLASDRELEDLSMPCLVIGAEDDISFPGHKLIERAETHIPDVKTELIEDGKHSPPTTPEFRKWLGNRIKTFVNSRK